MITSIYSHYSVDKSAIMMGLGLDSVIKIDFEATSVEEFEKIVMENNVFCLNSTFGTTSYGNLESVKKFDDVRTGNKCCLSSIKNVIYLATI